MLTTTTRSCCALSSIPNQDLQVKRLCQTWPKGKEYFYSNIKEVKEEGGGGEGGGGGGIGLRSGGGGGAGAGGVRSSIHCGPSVVVVPMSDVCPYPLRGNLSQNTGTTTTTTTTNSGSSSSSSSSSISIEEEQQRQQQQLFQNQQQSKSGLHKNMDNYSLDFERIGNTVNKLDICGWYYGQLSWQQATNLLKSKPVGTFLLRDSSDPLFLFALSVQTERGPTSVRIHYGDGQFKLDAENNLFGTMPLFDCVVQLVDYYVQLSHSDKSKAHVWLDDSGRRDLPVRLSRPLYCKVPQLQHLSRLVINETYFRPVQRLTTSTTTTSPPLELNLPKSLLSYIREYPYQR